MSLDRNEVEKVALLARLRPDEAEVEALTLQLSQILDLVKQLDSVDTTGVEPLAHPLDVVNVVVDDHPAPSLPRDRALANAPSRDEEYYRVPPVL